MDHIDPNTGARTNFRSIPQRQYMEIMGVNGVPQYVRTTAPKLSDLDFTEQQMELYQERVRGIEQRLEQWQNRHD